MGARPSVEGATPLCLKIFHVSYLALGGPLFVEQTKEVVKAPFVGMRDVVKRIEVPLDLAPIGSVVEFGNVVLGGLHHVEVAHVDSYGCGHAVTAAFHGRHDGALAVSGKGKRTDKLVDCPT